MASAIHYESLFDVFSELLPLVDARTYSARKCGEWEREVVFPFLRDKGFTEIEFRDGECDSFGPLSRIVLVFDPATKKFRQFIYG